MKFTIAATLAAIAMAVKQEVAPATETKPASDSMWTDD
jgi:hypothetical protein